MNNLRNSTKQPESNDADLASRFKARFGSATAPKAPVPVSSRKATVAQVKKAMDITVEKQPEIVAPLTENPPPEVVEPLLESTMESGLEAAIKKKRTSKGPREKKILTDGRGYCSQGNVPYSLFRRKAYGIFKEATSGGSLGTFTRLIAPIWKSIPAEERNDAHNNIDKYISLDDLRNAYYNTNV